MAKGALSFVTHLDSGLCFGGRNPIGENFSFFFFFFTGPPAASASAALPRAEDAAAIRRALTDYEIREIHDQSYSISVF